MRDIITKLEELNVEKEQLNEGLADMAHEAEKDHEVQMARSDCYKSAKYAVAIHKMLKDVSEMEGIDGWVAAKITKAADYLGSVKHYMEGQAMDDVELAVVPVAGDMTDAMTMPQESVEEGFKIRDKSRGYGVSDKTYATRAEAEEARLLKMAATGGNWEIIEEAEERDYICVHAKKGKYECSGTSSYAAAKKAAEHWGLKSTAGIDAHLADEEKTATESIEEAVISEDREVMVRATNIDYDGPALDKLPTDVNVKVMVNPGDGEDEIFDMVADELEDRYGVKVSGFDMKMMEQDAIEEEARPEDDTYGGAVDKKIDDILNLAGNKKKMPLPTPKPDVKTVNMPLPTPKPNAPKKPAVSAQQAQAQANQEVRSMAQDTTRPLRQSKFSEWSKK